MEEKKNLIKKITEFYKKKRLPVIIISSLVIVALVLAILLPILLTSNKKNGNSKGSSNKSVISYETYQSLATELMQAENLSYKAKRSMSYEDDYYLPCYDDYVPTSYLEVENAEVEIEKENFHIKESGSIKRELSISKTVELTDQFQEDIISDFVVDAYDWMDYSESRPTSYNIDLANDKLIFNRSGYINEEFLSYDKENKQYTLIEDNIGLYFLDKPRIDEFNLFERTFDKGLAKTVTDEWLILKDKYYEYRISGEVNNNHLTKLTIQIIAEDYFSEAVIEDIKLSGVSIDFPSYSYPLCYLDHNSSTCPYGYIETETGHRKYCESCSKFIGEEESHDFSKGYGVCPVCEMKQTPAHNNVPAGFEKEGGTPDYYIRVTDNEQACFDHDINMPEGFTKSNVTLEGKTTYSLFNDTKAILVSFEGADQELSQCLEVKEFESKLYKNLSESKVAEIAAKASNKTEFINAINEYTSAHEQDATYSKNNVDFPHYFTDQNISSLNPCVTYDTNHCVYCGLSNNAYIDINHDAWTLDDTVVIDACHSEKHYHCESCSEVKVDEIIHHNHTTTKEVELDACHKWEVEYCTDCGEEFYFVLHHIPTSTHKVVKQINPSESVTYTICDHCGIITDKEYN